MIPTSAIRGETYYRLEAPENYTEYAVYELGGRKVGRVKERFVSADDGVEYLDVKTGFLSLQSLLIPTEALRTDRKRRILLLR